jgi:hypothetical protein
METANRQVCAVEDYEWPSRDPLSVTQASRFVTAADHYLVDVCAKAASIDLSAVADNPREGLTLAEKVLRVLSHRKFQMNPVGAVRQEQEWLDRIDHAIQRNAPVEIVYPLFCVIPSTAKRYGTVGATAGEECTIKLFGLIDEYVRQIYPPGIVIHALVDSALYADAFQTSSTEVEEYSRSLAQAAGEAGADKYLQLHDYAVLLKEACGRDYGERYCRWCRDLANCDLARLVGEQALAGLRKSVRACVNTRQFALSHDDLSHLMGPPAVRDPSHPLYATIEQMTDAALSDYLAIRYACAEIDIATRLWPHALRATAHKGQKNGRWALGLRPYPEYYGSCKILPYHGVPKITHKNATAKLEVFPEVMLRGDDSLTRVMADNGHDVFAYLSPEVVV